MIRGRKVPRSMNIETSTVWLQLDPYQAMQFEHKPIRSIISTEFPFFELFKMQGIAVARIASFEPHSGGLASPSIALEPKMIAVYNLKKMLEEMMASRPLRGVGCPSQAHVVGRADLRSPCPI